MLGPDELEPGLPSPTPAMARGVSFSRGSARAAGGAEASILLASPELLEFGATSGDMDMGSDSR